MIRALLALNGALIRGAVAFVLAEQDDIDVVATLDRGDQIPSALRAEQPDVAIVDADLLRSNGWAHRAPPIRWSCSLLMLVDPRRPHALGDMLRDSTSAMGVLGHDVAPEHLVEAVRQLSRGEPVVDPALVVAALNQESPLTRREREVLEIAAHGWPVVEIADILKLAPGTVRNHLSRIVGKVGARTRIEAVRIARDAGWL